MTQCFVKLNSMEKNPHECNNHYSYAGPIRHEKESNSLDKVWCRLEIFNNFNPYSFIRFYEEPYGGRSLSYVYFMFSMHRGFQQFVSSCRIFSSLILVYLLGDVLNRERSSISCIFFGSFATLGRVQQSCVL
jgi:hypothetical protein